MLVKDRMTPNPITVTPTTSFPEAFRIIKENKIHHLPVMDEDGKLVGVVTQTDMMHASPSATTNVTVFEASYLMANLHIDGYAVLEELLVVLHRHGSRMAEVPITFINRLQGQSKLTLREAGRSMIQMLAMAIKR